MAITEKRPSVKLTVGAQYICFNTMTEDGAWTETFETDVVKLPTVTQVQVTDNIQETNLAFPDLLLARMRGDAVDGGVIVEGKVGATRPFFAYGFVVQKKSGELDLRWYPKCKVIENTDSTATSGESHSSQTDDITIRAYRMDDEKGIDVRVFTGDASTDKITEAKFFAAPILTAAAAKALQSA